MKRHPLPWRLLLLAATVSGVSAGLAANLFARDDTCKGSNAQSCPKEVAGRFCCDAGSACYSLAAGTTVICCPENGPCDIVGPISCNVRLQDASIYPGAAVKTSVFDVSLPKCGKDCCPFGYQCSKNGKKCVRDDDQSRPPVDLKPTSSTSSIATPSTTSTPADSASSTTSSSPSPSASSDPTPSSQVNWGPVIGGIIGGCAGLFLVIALAIFIIRRRKAADQTNFVPMRRSAASSGPYGHVISAPMLHPGSYRSDFLRGNPGSSSPTPGSTSPSNPQPAPPPPRISIPNPFDSPDPSPRSLYGARASVTSVDELSPKTGKVAGSRLAPIRNMRSSIARHSRLLTPHISPNRQSRERINVFADPDTVSDNPRATTMSGMMEQAGLGDVHRGNPYVPGTTPKI
ncbi:hypothetical protein HIM_07016 [Hirsutella minnesotensis 3608]|uniref:Mid2 domain-containing protein n=1 Tax=Hirsutella minnesotensis 3608 TaxID=1043627 RepID=A0A0F7ZTT7_9HYPO|nr:hypothetical protein HIM_07016 [Hirsutella minnesotensis 3608]